MRPAIRAADGASDEPTSAMICQTTPCFQAHVQPHSAASLSQMHKSGVRYRFSRRRGLVLRGCVSDAYDGLLRGPIQSASGAVYTESIN